MKSGLFIKLISSVYGVEEKTVMVFARNLKGIGYLSSGARGVNAPDMTPKDLAVITIALLATDKPSMAIDEFEYYSALQLDGSSEGSTFDPEIYGPNQTFLEYLTFVFSSEFCIPTEFEITFDEKRTVLVNHSGQQIRYHSRVEEAELKAIYNEYPGAEENFDTPANRELSDKLFEHFLASPAQTRLLAGIKVSRSLDSQVLKGLKSYFFEEANT